MYNTKKESRPAATESAILVKEMFENPRKDYNIRFGIKQVIFTILFFVLLATTVLMVADTSTATFVPVEHKVTYGDTLWNIAEQYKPDDMTMDNYMAWVYKHNDSSVIYPGDTVIMAEVVK
jgi:nucleoid-associated protein YgaU